MKTKIILFCSCLFFITAAMAQPKPKKKKPSMESISGAKNLRSILINMQSTDSIKGVDNFACNPMSYLDKLPPKKKIPRLFTVARALDTLKKGVRLKLPAPFELRKFKVFDHFVHTDNYSDFVHSLFKNHQKISPIKYRDLTKDIYNKLLPLRESRYIIHEDTYKSKGCIYNVTTSMSYDPKQFKNSKISEDPYKNTGVDWNVHSTIKLSCSCKENDQTKLKKAVFEFSGMAYSRGVTSYSLQLMNPDDFTETDKQRQYFLEVKDVECCPGNEPKTEDGSFMEPDEDEDIFFEKFIEVGAGIGTAKDEETELCASVGYMHNLLPGEDNALFIGGRASVNNASFNGPDFNQTLINVGPAVEYQTFIGDTSTKWINGVNGAFVFGSQDSSGFKTDISGIHIGLYTGVEVPLGNQFALGVLATLVELNNLTFKTGESEFKSNSTGINLNKGSVGLSLRIALDKK